ncbi:Queuine tRNA-ribosyltransferase accessory subunit 2 [Chionoecetes opilio]|uniref:Queuine tRNA-ribosyltransferase accessory subunit 2 n=1 Tax=Chionoecetes opilio TaxID=41210 RepID=A0A8J4Y155_CHIOP|nr:Queuine tRNA-ribosyltransferase accessory subunit 2 [Chionoecetes opilio]
MVMWSKSEVDSQVCECCGVVMWSKSEVDSQMCECCGVVMWSKSEVDSQVCECCGVVMWSKSEVDSQVCEGCDVVMWSKSEVDSQVCECCDVVMWSKSEVDSQVCEGCDVVMWSKSEVDRQVCECCGVVMWSKSEVDRQVCECCGVVMWSQVCECCGVVMWSQVCECCDAVMWSKSEVDSQVCECCGVVMWSKSEVDSQVCECCGVVMWSKSEVDSQDVLHLVAGREAPLCVPAQHFCQHVKVLQDFKKGVAHFAALQSHSVGVVVQDPTKVTPSGYNDKQGVSTWTYGGRHILNAQTYMRLVEAMQPDWYEALSDADTPLGASKKRVSKSLAQSKVYVSACLHHHKESQALQGCGLLVPLLGGHSQAERARWSQGVCQWVEEGAGVCGYVVQGLHTSGPEVERLTPGHVTELVRTSLECLPEGGVVQAGGSWSPALVVSLVELGVDMFDSSFPHLVTQRNGALTFPHSHALDQGPLLDGCECYTCRHFTRAYIHHLINVREMLAPVLLMM